MTDTPTTNTSPELMTPAEVAALYRVDPKTVTRWAQAGQLASVRTVGGHRRYYADEVRAVLGGDTTPATPTGCPAWCERHTAGRDAITGAASAVHYGAGVTVPAPVLDDGGVTVIPVLAVTEASAALTEQVDGEVHLVRANGASSEITLDRAATYAGWLAANAAPHAAAAVRNAASQLATATGGAR